MAKINRYLRQSDDALIAVKPFNMTIDMSEYNLSDSLQIKEVEGIIWVKSLISKAEFDDIVINIMLDYPVELQTQKMEYIPKEKITLSYLKEDVVLTVPFTTVEIKQQINYVDRLLGGKEIYKDPSHLIKKLLNIYGPVSDLDLAHFEVLASQVLRDKKDHSQPARLGKPWDPIMANIKTDVFSTSFIQGLAFENIGKAIDTGLTTSKTSEQSIIEKVLTGELVKVRKR